MLAGSAMAFSGTFNRTLLKPTTRKMASLFSSTSSKAMSTSTQQAFVTETLAKNPVVIFSKSYCPYCTQTKELFANNAALGKPLVIEMDEVSDGGNIQAALAETQNGGQRTVPNVFVWGTHLGGNSDVQSAFKSGHLQKLIEKK